VAGEPLTGDFREVHFDLEGNLMESYSIDTRGDTIGKSVCRRENGEIVEEIFYTRFFHTPVHSSMYQTSRTVLEHVSEDQINFEVWKGDQRINEGANYYDKKGNLVRQVQVLSDREVTIHYIYEKDLLVENYQEDMNGERTATQLYDYKDFDDHKNWTLRLIYAEEDKIAPNIAISREIVYY
jgi:hypothetical protein